MNRPQYILIVLLLIFFSWIGCEDVITVELEDGGTSLVVDAWINNLNEEQIIQLNESQPYFDNSLPTAVSDAVVKVTRDDGQVFEFNYGDNGAYIYDGAISGLGQTGDQLTLNILYDNVNYEATSIIRPVPSIDSIGIEFREDEVFGDDGLYAQFYARDFQGAGDTYWIKTFKNDEYLDKSQEINLAYDAGFDAGTGIDGLIFIPPIRELVNALDEDLLPTPYSEGDIIRVEIHSISNAAFNFMEIARDQINNGDNGIFSIPLANARTNINSSSNNQALGFFNVAAVSSLERLVE